MRPKSSPAILAQGGVEATGTPIHENPGVFLENAIEGALKRDRVVVLAALVLVLGLCWAYLLSGAGMGISAFEMTRMTAGSGGMAMMTPAVWSFGYAVLMFFMWWVMMTAMMLPSATPMVLLFATMNRRERKAGNPYVPTSIFASAYLIVWAGFSLAAVALQWGLESLALLSPVLASANAAFGGVVLLAAGTYQLTPLKQACLRHCRSPLQFIFAHWRSGADGAFWMGLQHGTYCVGCCWFLMGLLFFGGVMNLYWIAGIAGFVLLEKSVPRGHWLSSVTGTALIVGGGFVLAGIP
jgi:predicted metal-binding membrane protein